MSDPSRLPAVLALLVAGLVALAGCGGAGDAPAPSAKRVVLAELDTTDSEVVGELYRRLLDQAGFTTRVREFGARELYLDPLAKGGVQVAADYASSTVDALGGTGSPNPATALAALTALARDRGVTVLRPTRAEVGTRFVVTADLARSRGLRTLGDLGRSGKAVSMATAPDCQPVRSCTAGLEETYGIALDRVAPLDGDTLAALRGGTVQLAQVTSTDPALDSPDLVVLQDDRRLATDETLVPMVNTTWLRTHPRAREAVERLAPVLTTTDLRRMVNLVARDGRPVGEVVQEYLTQQGLV